MDIAFHVIFQRHWRETQTPTGTVPEPSHAGKSYLLASDSHGVDIFLVSHTVNRKQVTHGLHRALDREGNGARSTEEQRE